MAYDYEKDVISELEQMGVDYESNGYFNMSIEVEEVYRKAKAFDEVKEFVSEKLDEDIRHYHCFKSERDNGELAAYERIDDIIQEYLERADDEN